MTDFRTLHEGGVLRDVFDWITSKPNRTANTVDTTLTGLRGFITGRKVKQPNMVINSNIAKSARALTAVFPVIVSKSVDIEKAVMVSKAIERKCVTMLQMLFAANQITNVTSAKEYLNNFHNNISSSLDLSQMDIDDVLRYTMSESETIDDYMSIARDCIEAINEDVKNNIHYTLPTLTSHSIADMSVTNEAYIRGSQGYKVSNKRTNVDKEKKVDSDGKVTRKTISRSVKDSEFVPFSSGEYKNWADIMNKQVLDVDIRKANEAQPSLMIINFISSLPNGGETVQNTCVIGVKAVIHYVDPQDIVNRVVLKKSDSRGLFNLIRATTREISFFKDFLFAVNRAKVDAVAKSGKGSTDKIWKLLELRADRLKGANVSQNNQAGSAAIATLVISQAEVDYIKQFHRIDLNKPGTLNSILRGYNMMACAVIDDVSEKVNFLWDDGSSAFESLSFMSLEREDSGSMYKKIINLATRGR